MMHYEMLSKLTVKVPKTGMNSDMYLNSGCMTPDRIYNSQQFLCTCDTIQLV